MKSNYLYAFAIFSLLILPYSLFGQTTGKVNYIAILESEEFQELESKLYFTDKESFFFVDMKASKRQDYNNGEIELIDNTKAELEFDFSTNRLTKHEVYINRNEKIILSQSSIFKDLTSKPCVVEEESGSFIWKITGETKKVGSFIVNKATTSFRGRNYSAWFTTEIPIGIGPWKFNGLPGLILEIKDDELGVQFLFSSITIPYEVDKKIIKPNEGEKISVTEYAKYQGNFAKELIKSLKAKLPRDLSVGSISVKEVNKSIEREYQR
jgi:GLPGLI family protein